MPSDYKIWQSAPLSKLEYDALLAFYRAWRAGKPTDREHVVFDLVQAGAKPREADAAVQAIELSQPERLSLLESGRDREMLPTLAATIALSADEDASADLADLELIVRHANASYTPDHKTFPIDTFAAALGLEREHTARLARLGRLGNAERVTLPSTALMWTSFEEFLGERLHRVGSSIPAEAPIAITAVIKQVRWRQLGVYQGETTLDLRTPMTVLVGANGVGKTTALAALAMLKDLAGQGLAAITKHHARLPSGADELELGAVAELNRAGTSERVAWEFHVGRAGRLHARSELLRRDESLLASFDRGTGRWMGDDQRLVEHSMRADQLALTTATEPATHWQLIALRQHLQRWHIELAAAQLTDDKTLDLVWHRYDEHPDALEILRAQIRAVTGVEIVREARSLFVVDRAGHKVPRAVAATGVVRAIDLLARLFDPEPPTLLAIDEIENHLHGDLAARLIDVMRSVSHRTQIVLTTHSARVVRSFDSAEVRLVRRNDKTSSIVSIGDDPQLARLLEIGEIGALLHDGYLTGAP